MPNPISASPSLAGYSPAPTAPAAAPGSGDPSLVSLQQLGGFSASPPAASAALPSLLSQDAFQAADPNASAVPTVQPTRGQIFGNGVKVIAHQLSGPLAFMGALRRERYLQLTGERLPSGFAGLGRQLDAQGTALSAALGKSRFGALAKRPFTRAAATRVIQGRQTVIGLHAAQALLTPVKGPGETKIGRRILWAEQDLQKLGPLGKDAKTDARIASKAAELASLQKMARNAPLLISAARNAQVQKVAATAAPGTVRAAVSGVSRKAAPVGHALGWPFKALGQLAGKPFQHLSMPARLGKGLAGMGRTLGKYSPYIAVVNGVSDAKRAWTLFQDPSTSPLKKFLAVAAIGGDVAGAASILNPELAPMVAILGDGVSMAAGMMRDMPSRTPPTQSAFSR